MYATNLNPGSDATTLLAGTAGVAGAGLVSLSDIPNPGRGGPQGWSQPQCRCGGCAWRGWTS
jgi:hypothetical protein